MGGKAKKEFSSWEIVGKKYYLHVDVEWNPSGKKDSWLVDIYQV
jgi:hypothetical protein